MSRHSSSNCTHFIFNFNRTSSYTRTTYGQRKDERTTQRIASRESIGGTIRVTFQAKFLRYTMSGCIPNRPIPIALF
jgi:hypothetical protein